MLPYFPRTSRASMPGVMNIASVDASSRGSFHDASTLTPRALLTSVNEHHPLGQSMAYGARASDSDDETNVFHPVGEVSGASYPRGGGVTASLAFSTAFAASSSSPSRDAAVIAIAIAANCRRDTARASPPSFALAPTRDGGRAPRCAALMRRPRLGCAEVVGCDVDAAFTDAARAPCIVRTEDVWGLAVVVGGNLGACVTARDVCTRGDV